MQLNSSRDKRILRTLAPEVIVFNLNVNVVAYFYCELSQMPRDELVAASVGGIGLVKVKLGQSTILSGTTGGVKVLGGGSTAGIWNNASMQNKRIEHPIMDLDI